MYCFLINVFLLVEISSFFLKLRIRLGFFCFFFFFHSCILGNGHFFQVVHFQKKLLKVELWVSRLSPPKSYDWSTRKKGPIRDHLAKKLSIAFTLSYLVFCWPLLRAKADSLTSRSGAAATLLFHLALWEHKCLCPPTTLINLMQLILPVVWASGSIQRGPQMDDAAEAFPQTSVADKCGVG